PVVGGGPATRRARCKTEASHPAGRWCAGRRQTCAWRDLRHTTARSAATSATSTSTLMWAAGPRPGRWAAREPEASAHRRQDRAGRLDPVILREEFADHGIPFGGRHGGDPDPVLDEPRPRGTSPEGGSDRTADD